MNWQLKSTIQRACAALPFAQEQSYYLIQRTFGRLRNPAPPVFMFKAAVEIAEELRGLGFSVEGARVAEVGTGRRIDFPLALYLCGAKSVVTTDLHRYLKAELVIGAVDYVRGHREEIAQIFRGSVAEGDLNRRLDALIGARSLDEILKVAGIQYQAPGDASQTGLPAGSIDLQVSYTVFEHIPRDVLLAILKEASRILSPTGLACHHIDPSDHFSHDDGAISAINFLKYPERDWQKYNENQFAYHNRLRVTDYAALYEEAGHEVLHTWEAVDQRSLEELGNGFPLAPEYRGVEAKTLATTVVRVVSRARVVRTSANSTSK